MYALEEQRVSVTGYARVLYDNYRARLAISGVILPDWNGASPIVKDEFKREAQQVLS